MITQIFGDILFYPKSECLQGFPSPEELKYRIIISTKPPKEYLEAKGSEDKGNNIQKEKDSDDDAWGEEPSSVTADPEKNDKVCLERFYPYHVFYLMSDHLDT